MVLDPLKKKTVHGRLYTLVMGLGNGKLEPRGKGVWVLEADEDQSMIAQHYRSRGVLDHWVNVSWQYSRVCGGFRVTTYTG